jgi:hypothetical protein
MKMSNFTITYNLDDSRIIPFLLNDDRSSIYHHPAWLKAIENTFKHKAFYLLLEDNQSNITGLYPFIFLKSKITGKRIVSLPFSSYCNPLLPKDRIKEAISFLIDTFKNKTRIDLRILDKYTEELNNFSHSEDFVTHILELNSNIQKTFDSFHPTSVRASIRRAEKKNLTIRFGDSESDLKFFYNLETSLRKRLLLPPLPFSFFSNVYREMKPLNLIFLPLVEKDNIPIAAGFILRFKDTYYLEYTASDKSNIGLYPNHKLFWEVIKLAQDNGASRIDFGRTSLDNESLIIFKEKWCAKKTTIHNSVYPKRGIIKDRQSVLKKYLMKLNTLLPVAILKIEGNVIYPHLD